MKKEKLLALTTLLVLPWLFSGCTAEKANAESPCPATINSANIVLLDSISNEPISTATLVLAGSIYDKSLQQFSDSEITVDYSSELELYHLPYESGGIEINMRNLTIYTSDSTYHSNVSKPDFSDKGCTSLEYTIYLCPNGTACR